jgi:hypothetical protein
MTDTEALAGYLSRYLARRAETAGDPVDWVGHQLCALVANKLRDDPALQELAGEASAGEGAISPATLRRTALALAAATEHDPNFARALAVHFQRCEAAEAAMGSARSEDDDTALGEPGFLAGYVRYLIPGSAAAAVLSARESLANYLNDPEHPGLGLDLVQSMVTDCSYQQNLGIEHPFTRTARNHLARFLGVTGHPAAASAAFEALLSDCVMQLGPEHPVVRGSNLILFLGDDVSLWALSTLSSSAPVSTWAASWPWQRARLRPPGPSKPSWPIACGRSARTTRSPGAPTSVSAAGPQGHAPPRRSRPSSAGRWSDRPAQRRDIHRSRGRVRRRCRDRLALQRVLNPC